MTVIKAAAVQLGSFLYSREEFEHDRQCDHRHRIRTEYVGLLAPIFSPPSERRT